MRSYYCFFFNDTATTEIYTLSLHDALPICFQVWQWSNAEVVSRVIILFLVYDERDEEAQFRYLYGNRLNVHTIDAVFDKVEFTRIVRVVYILIESSFYIGNRFSSFFRSRRKVRFGSFINGKLQKHIFPTTIIGVNLLKDMHHLLKYTHRECARTTSGVENLTVVERLHNSQLLLFGECGFVVGVGKQQIGRAHV